MEEDNGVALLGSTEGESIVRNESAIRDIVQNYQNAPNITVRVVPVLANHAEHRIPVKTCRPKVQHEERVLMRSSAFINSIRAHSFSGAMIDTTLLWVANMDAICLIMLSVRCTLVLFECHPG